MIKLTAILAGIIWLVACSPGDGPRGGCPEGEKECSDGICYPCCSDDDCPPDWECFEDGCYDGWTWYEGQVCPPDRGGCPGSLVCDPFSDTCAWPCQSDAACIESHSEVDFAADLGCQTDGRCDFAHCQTDPDCDPPRVCYAGDCLTPTCGLDATCTIVPGAVTVRDGSSATLVAWAQHASGNMLPGLGFEWTSSDASVASAADGIVTGGSVAGAATITATNAVCSIVCSTQVRNLGPEAGGLRVLAVDAATGEPLAGVRVEVEGVGSADTDAGGVAVFAGADLSASPASVTLSGEDVGYVSLVRAAANDLLVPVSLAPDAPQTGGVRGRFDFDRLRCEPGNPCEVKLGMAGLSAPGWPLDWSLLDLLGEPVMMHVELGGTVEDLAYPGGTVVGFNDTWFREEFTALGDRGQRVVWGVGGRMNLADLIGTLGPSSSGPGPGDLLSSIAYLFGMFEQMGTILGPLVLVEGVDRVPDSDDVDGDGSTEDLVPDYQGLPRLGEPLTFKVPSQLSMRIQVPELPLDQEGGHVYDGLFVMAGVLVEGAGLIPLGLAAASDAPTDLDEPDGFIDTIALRTSDVAGRLPAGSYQRVVLALAVCSDQFEVGADPQEPFRVSGQAHFVDRFPEELTLRPFAHPPIFQHHPVDRELTIQYLDAEARVMVVLGEAEGQGAKRGWKIFAQAALGPFELPFAQAAGDRLDRVGVAALRLADGVTFSDLVVFSDDNLDDLAGLVTDFSIVYPSGHGPLVGCQTTSGRAGLPFLCFAVCCLSMLTGRRKRGRSPGDGGLGYGNQGWRAVPVRDGDGPGRPAFGRREG